MVSTRIFKQYLPAPLRTGIAVVFAGIIGAAGYAAAQAPAAPAAPPPTPRTADGKPDFAGLWVGGTGGGAGLPSGANFNNFASRDGTFFGFEEDNGLSRMSLRNKPAYKPEFWDAVQMNDYRGNWDDPVHKCYPAGVPAVGAPGQILKIEGQPALMLVYQAGFNGYMGRYLNHNEYRMVWTDGRPHDPAALVAESWNGSAVGRWEGDTLVIETVGFTDESWLSRSGWIHGFEMKVTERLTRTGNTLRWEATVEDPEYFAEPWVMMPITRALNTRAGAFLPQSPPCYNPDKDLLVSPTQSG